MAEVINEIQFEVQVGQRNLKSFHSLCQFLSKIGKHMIFGEIYLIMSRTIG
jgi:hypothetical protein